MQGYDAIKLETDVQIGGVDQLFNLLIGRELQRAVGQKPQIAITLPLLVGTDGTMKMSKSYGNAIGLWEEPKEMYGKVMSVPDKAMGDFYRFLTRFTPAEIDAIEADLGSGKLHPRDAKMKLAFEIVSIYHSEDAARDAQDAFVRVFQKGDAPEEMPRYQLSGGQTVLDVLANSGIVSSRGEGRRMIKQNAVSLNDAKLTDPFAPFPGSGVLRVGRRKFLQIVD